MILCSGYTIHLNALPEQPQQLSVGDIATAVVATERNHSNLQWLTLLFLWSLLGTNRIRLLLCCLSRAITGLPSCARERLGERCVRPVLHRTLRHCLSTWYPFDSAGCFHCSAPEAVARTGLSPETPPPQTRAWRSSNRSADVLPRDGLEACCPSLPSIALLKHHRLLSPP